MCLETYNPLPRPRWEFVDYLHAAIVIGVAFAIFLGVAVVFHAIKVVLGG